MIANDGFSNRIGLLFALELIIGSASKGVLCNWFQTLLHQVYCFITCLRSSDHRLMASYVINDEGGV